MTDVVRQQVAAGTAVLGDTSSSNRMKAGGTGASAVPVARGDDLALGPEQSHRIIAMLEDATERLGFLGSIMPDVLQHRDELSKFVGDEISRIIQVRCQHGRCDCTVVLKIHGSTFCPFI